MANQPANLIVNISNVLINGQALPVKKASLDPGIPKYEMVKGADGRPLGMAQTDDGGVPTLKVTLATRDDFDVLALTQVFGATITCLTKGNTRYQLGQANFAEIGELGENGEVEITFIGMTCTKQG